MRSALLSVFRFTRRVLHVLPAHVCSSGGDCQAISVSDAGSVQSAAISGTHVMVTCTVPVFVRQGANPTAVNNGTDEFLVDGAPYSLLVTSGNKLAFRAPSGGSSGTAYITPL